MKVKELRVQNNQSRLKSIIQYIIDNYIYSANGNSKKGGLIALAAVVIGLGRDSYRYIHMVIPPVLRCFSDSDHRVRYYSAEALYNLAKGVCCVCCVCCACCVCCVCCVCLCVFVCVCVCCVCLYVFASLTPPLFFNFSSHSCWTFGSSIFL